MTQLFFSRLSLRQDQAIRVIAANLLGEDHPESAVNAKHRLIWSIFSDNPDRQRDFLWREDKHGVFYTLSAREPAGELFDIDTKPFEPALAIGDRLSFALRANPVIAVKEQGAKRGKRRDVVMNALYEYRKADPSKRDPGERQDHRNRLIVETGTDWFSKQGERYGFNILTLQVDGYQQHRLPRKDKKPDGNVSTLDFEGVLQVANPTLFLEKLAQGFGSAKAFGNGLMLIRRT